MIYPKHKDELNWFIGEIDGLLDQDNVSDWDIILMSVIKMMPLATLDELETWWHKSLRKCNMNVYDGTSRHVIVQLWVEMYLDEMSKI